VHNRVKNFLVIGLKINQEPNREGNMGNKPSCALVIPKLANTTRDPRIV
jgi:hypothetical protein